jgi:hypothetical protein
MSALKPGTLCVIVGGCPENIGMIVEVVSYLGVYPPYDNAYRIKTVTSRNFPQLWTHTFLLVRGYQNTCVTDRSKLRPLPEVKDLSEAADGASETIRAREGELVASRP